MNTTLFSFATTDTAGTFGRRQRADEEVDVLLQDQLARDAHRLVGVAFRVARQQLELAAEYAALGVDLVDVHLGALQRRLAEQRARSRQDHREADLDRLLGVGTERQREQRRRKQGGYAQHWNSPLV
jgi:hypothetical protein